MQAANWWLRHPQLVRDQAQMWGSVAWSLTLFCSAAADPAHTRTCRTCGICSHYRPRSNPDCVAVTIYCIDPSTPLQVVAVRNFHGQQWERSFEASDLAQAGVKAAAQ